MHVFNTEHDEASFEWNKNMEKNTTNISQQAQ